MAQASRERLKRLALVGFVAVCVGLIGLIWAEGLTANVPATPSYYRDTFRMDEDMYLTVTAEASEYQRNLEEGTPTPTPTPNGNNGHGDGQGQGAGRGAEHTATPEPGG